MTHVEEADYLVTATLVVRIPFSPIERETPLCEQDAVANAMGTMPDRLWEDLEAEGWSISFEAERLS